MNAGREIAMHIRAVTSSIRRTEANDNRSHIQSRPSLPGGLAANRPAANRWQRAAEFLRLILPGIFLLAGESAFPTQSWNFVLTPRLAG